MRACDRQHGAGLTCRAPVDDAGSDRAQLDTDADIYINGCLSMGVSINGSINGPCRSV
jgi:hypothetical protein